MHFRQWLVTAGWCVSALVTASESAAQSITISEGADGSSCYMPDIQPGGSSTAYIHAWLGGPTGGGITGAEFRVVGMPPEMIVSVTPNPAANLFLGNPFGGGCNIAFPLCQTGTSFGAVLLYTVNLSVPPTGVPHYILDVEQHATPSGPNFPCPLVTLCDAPVFTKVCVSGGHSGPGPLLAVPSNPTPADAATDVTPATDLAWGFTGPGFCCGIGTPFTNVYFGTTPAPPLVHQYDNVERTHDPGELEPLTTYYWRIGWTPDHDCGAVGGPVWSFTTGDKVGIEAATWQAVKGMFR